MFTTATSLPDPTFLNVEYLFFLVYRFVRGIWIFLKSFFFGFSGDKTKLREWYQSSSAGDSCNPFLGDVCSSQSGGMSGLDLFGGVSGFGVGLRIFLILLCLFLIAVIVYSYLQWREIKNASDRHIESLIPTESPDNLENKRWAHVQSLIASHNPTDWKMAILEADVMLEDMTRALGLPGDTLADRLKSVEPSDFLTLQKAWEAHKIRNQIAHQGSNFALEHRQAILTIRLYEEVFHEFRLI